MAALVVLACLLLTAASSWATARADEGTERRLLLEQTKQAAAVLSTAILLIQEPLDTALGAQKVAGAAGDPRAFRALMAPSVGPAETFASASLWKRRGAGFRMVASVGALDHTFSPAGSLRRALTTAGFTVRLEPGGGMPRIAYAEADPSSGFLVYAERPIPANRRAAADSNAAFAELHYALYLGRRATPAMLATTDVAATDLPLSGATSRVSIPFGDTSLLFVTSARHHLGAPLSERLPLFLLVGGLLITAIAGRSAYLLSRGRQEAEEGATTLAGLYEQVGALYGEQRDLFERLQRALLPQVNPEIPCLEVASRYVAGGTGLDIGGDWYSIIELDDDNVGFVVGDVSGHGVDAVAVMAHARFTLRAYLLDGDAPEEALEKSSRQFDISRDGHMTTAVVGVGNWRTGRFRLANAGHPTPLVLGPDGPRFVATATGPPLGTGPRRYRSTVVDLTPGSVFFAFTDGLVERRREDIDTGMARLSDALADSGAENLDTVVDRALGRLRHDGPQDDIAVLALRWLGADHAPPAAVEVERTRFPGDPQAPAAARAFVAARLRHAPAPAAVLVDDVVLVVSELVTNAVRAGASAVEVTLRIAEDGLELLVSDDAEGWPTERAATSNDLGGRGLAIVDRLTGSWSAFANAEGGKSVRATWTWPGRA